MRDIMGSPKQMQLITIHTAQLELQEEGRAVKSWLSDIVRI